MNGDKYSYQTAAAQLGEYPRGPMAAQTEARQAEIPHQLEKLERTLRNCTQGLESLEVRLGQSVMRSEGPTNGAKDPSAIQATAMGSQLQSLTNIAAEINVRIQSMAERLEV